MKYILAVVDWIKNTLILSFFSIPSQLAGAGLRIHYEFCPAHIFVIEIIVLT